MKKEDHNSKVDISRTEGDPHYSKEFGEFVFKKPGRDSMSFTRGAFDILKGSIQEEIIESSRDESPIGAREHAGPDTPLDLSIED